MKTIEQKQQDIIRRLNETRARLLAEMSDEDRELCLTLDAWKTEEDKAAIGMATPATGGTR